MTKLLKVLLIVFLVLPGTTSIAQQGTEAIEFLYFTVMLTGLTLTTMIILRLTVNV